MKTTIERIGSSAILFVEGIGKLVYFFQAALYEAFRPPARLGQLCEQIVEQGARTLFIIILTALATGMVLAVQASVILERFGAKEFVAEMVALSLVRELGPLIATIVFIGKAGAKITAELGSMNVSEQIKATRAMAIDPIEFFITSRVLSCLIVVPLLTVVANIIGVVGGYIISVFDLHVHSSLYIQQTWKSVKLADFMSGLVKAEVFAILVSTICCYKGFTTQGGSLGVGRYTTEAVAYCIIAVIIANFILTKILITFLA